MTFFILASPHQSIKKPFNYISSFNTIEIMKKDMHNYIFLLLIECTLLKRKPSLDIISLFVGLIAIGFPPTKHEFRTLSRPKSKRHLKYQAPNILYMTNMLGAFIFGNEF
ncbi:hypothetical protein COJ48_22850 [Bacillus cereus]|nr:hypothetical protein COJ48_22850 [Bacillus cereus]